MFEIRQQVAQGTQDALNMYKVYRFAGQAREYLGWFARGSNTKFNPFREYTDTDKKAILKAVNEYLTENGYAAISRYGNHGLTQAQIESLLQKAGLAKQEEEEDDDE